MVSISNSNQTRKLCFLVILNKKNFVETKKQKTQRNAVFFENRVII